MATEKVSLSTYDGDGSDRIQRRKRILENQECEICGDRSTGKHYGVYSCDGCSGFFKRTCHRTEPFLCKGCGDCKVDKSSRNDCKACRLRKCLQTGMNVDGVQGRALRRSKKVGLIAANQVKDEVIPIGDDDQAELDSCTNYTAVVQGDDNRTVIETPASPRLYLQLDCDSREVSRRSPELVTPCPQGTASTEPPQHIPLTPLGTVVPSQVKEHAVMLSTCVTKSTSSPVPRTRLTFHRRPDSEANDREHGRALLAGSSENSVRKLIDITTKDQPHITQSSVILPPDNCSKAASQALRSRIVSNIRPLSYDGIEDSRLPFLTVSGITSSKQCTTPKSTYSAQPLTPPLSPLPELVKAVEPVLFDASESIQDAATRLLSSSMRFARQALCVGRICLRDQIILMEESWKERFILAAAYWDLPFEFAPLVNAGAVFDDATSARFKLDVFRAFQELVTRIRSLQLDSTEFACLKAIVLFKSETKGLKFMEVVETIQDETQVLLGNYIRTKHPNQPQRFGKLLLTLSTIGRLADKPLEEVFFKKSDEKDMFETLLSQMVSVA